MKPDQLESFLSSATPYHFTITNECSELANATINLESINPDTEKQLEDQYIYTILYETNYNTNLNSQKQLTKNPSNDSNKVLKDSNHAYELYSFTLNANETKEFNLLLYMNPDTPMVDANMNASWKGKITLSTNYKEENTTLRQISSSDTQGMWEYKDKITKIVIEDKLSTKIGDTVHGPFDESEDDYGVVQSYVVCDASDENCTGYLQGTNGIKGNEDSTGLFSGFRNVTNIEGLENFDTSNVTNMTAMFSSMTNLQELDLSMWNTIKVTDITAIFSGCSALTKANLSNWDLSKINNFSNWIYGSFSLNNGELNMSNVRFPENCSSFLSNGPGFSGSLILKNVDTSHVTNMSFMFAGAKLTELDLSDFDTSNVTDMSSMFIGTTGLQSIIFSSKFVHKQDAKTSGMFLGCSAPERPFGTSWNGVSFD